jgi:hypothetical protein
MLQRSADRPAAGSTQNCEQPGVLETAPASVQAPLPAPALPPKFSPRCAPTLCSRRVLGSRLAPPPGRGQVAGAPPGYLPLALRPGAPAFAVIPTSRIAPPGRGRVDIASRFAPELPLVVLWHRGPESGPSASPSSESVPQLVLFFFFAAGVISSWCHSRLKSGDDGRPFRSARAPRAPTVGLTNGEAEGPGRKRGSNREGGCHRGGGPARIGGRGGRGLTQSDASNMSQPIRHHKASCSSTKALPNPKRRMRAADPLAPPPRTPALRK